MSRLDIGVTAVDRYQFLKKNRGRGQNLVTTSHDTFLV